VSTRIYNNIYAARSGLPLHKYSYHPAAAAEGIGFPHAERYASRPPNVIKVGRGAGFLPLRCCRALPPGVLEPYHPHTSRRRRCVFGVRARVINIFTILCITTHAHTTFGGGGTTPSCPDKVNGANIL